MAKKLLDIYSQLDINNKRNEFSNLLLKVEHLLNQLPSMDEDVKKSSKVKNYNINEDQELTEDELLVFFYEDLWNIKNKILSLHILKK